jgi:hypothetical protein
VAEFLFLCLSDATPCALRARSAMSILIGSKQRDKIEAAQQAAQRAATRMMEGARNQPAPRLIDA